MLSYKKEQHQQQVREQLQAMLTLKWALNKELPA